MNDSIAMSEIRELSKNNMVEHLGIEITGISDGFVTGTMPVDHRTVRPGGILHGGASVAFSETLGSIGALLSVNDKQKTVMGIEVNANHIRSAPAGSRVTGKAQRLFNGRTTQIWETRIVNEQDKLVCVSRLTVLVKDMRPDPQNHGDSATPGG